VVKCAVIGLASGLARSERTPAGTVIVTRVDGLKGTFGMDISVASAACQLPGMLGRAYPARRPIPYGRRKRRVTTLAGVAR
jgi:hypothetical protein